MNIFTRGAVLATRCNFWNHLILRCNGIESKITKTAKQEQKPTESKQNPPSAPKPAREVFIAAHVTAGQARAAAICSKGKVLYVSETSIKVYQIGIFNEMSSENVWTNLIKCIKTVTTKLEPTDHIKGIGFISIPGLVCLDEKGMPVTASASNDPNINIILHYDPRSTLEARTISKTHHERLRYAGERVLSDMHESKLMWLKNNLKENCWDKVGHFMTMTDFLTWKATGSLVRSSCCLSAKWSYVTGVSKKPSWDAQFFQEIGIPEVAENNFRKIGSEVQTPGKPLADGLLEAVAQDMNLPSKLPVATGMTEAFAGCLGLLGCQIQDNIAQEFTSRMCIVVGVTSASHFVFSRNPLFVKGAKGPFRDNVLPNMWSNHAEQTTAESVLKYIIDSHPATPFIKKEIAQM